jgi:integrase
LLVEDKKRGGWRGAVVLADGSRRFVRGKEKSDVIQRMRALQGHAAAGTRPPSSTKTLREAATYWLDVVIPARRRRGAGGKSVPLAGATIEQYRWAVGIINDELGRARLARLDREGVEAFLGRLAAQEYSANSIGIVRKTLIQVLDEAQDRKWVTENVARRAIVPASATAPAERDTLSDDEARRLLKAAASDRLGPYWTVALQTGARRGELLGLAWSDVDLDKGTMTIQRALRRRAGGGYEVGPTKTKGSVRNVELSPSALRALRDQQRRQMREHLAAEQWSDTGLVFTTKAGTHLDPGVVRRSWSAITKEAGLEGRVPHELRHTTGSQLVDAGVPLTVVADQLGHADVNMLARTYRHRTKPRVEGVADVMEKFTAPKRRSR